MGAILLVAGCTQFSLMSEGTVGFGRGLIELSEYEDEEHSALVRHRGGIGFADGEFRGEGVARDHWRSRGGKRNEG